MENNLTIIQLNKGISDFSSRSDQINDLICKYKPQIVILNELNLKNTDTVTKNIFDNYTLENDDLDVVDGMLRTGVLIHNSLQYKRRRDLESMGTSTVWVQFSYPGRKSLLLQAIYRQFQRLGRKGSIAPTFQLQRWTKIIQKWEAAIAEKKQIISMGDYNLNLLRWDIEQNKMNSYDRQKKPLIEMLKNRILDKDHVILSQTPTKLSYNPQTEDSCLDLMITNRPQKIASFQAGIPIFSDHCMQILVRKTKEIKTNKKIIRTRIFKKF